MGLSLTLDHALQIVAEPGYFQRFGSEIWEKQLNPVSGTDHKAFWSDEATRTLMLYPQQLRPGFLNSSAQLDSIIGLVERGSGVLQVNNTNFTAGRIYEAALKGNLNNPWVHFTPIPGGGFLDILGSLAIAALEARFEFPATTADFRVIAFTKDKLTHNQPLVFRWFQPDQRVGSLFLMGLSVGQFTLVFTGDLMEVHEDISPGHDRTAFRRLMSVPMFSSGSTAYGANSGAGGRASVDEAGPGDRAIFWLPFHRNLIYVLASSGKWAIIDSRTIPRLNGQSGNNQDWDIVEQREAMVFGISPSVGRFQLQKVKFHSTAAQIRLPSIVIDYSPAAPIVSGDFVDDADTFRGTSITRGVPSTPPGYDNYANTLDSCPAVTTDGTAQTRTYGVTYTFTPSGDARFTPFLYGVELRKAAVFGTWPVTGTTFGDDASTPTRIVNANYLSDIDQPEQAQLRAEVLDGPPISIAPLWYRSEYPVRLQNTVGPTTLFLGIARPTQVEPPIYATNRPRKLEMRAESLWRWLADSPLRDQRDWTGTGHITVVDFIARQAGIDTTGADYPPLADWNTPLGGVNTRIPQHGALKPHWRPNDNDTAASFIKRIAEQFSGYIVGFYPNGTFYYLPRDPWFYNTSEITFKKSRQTDPSDPIYHDPVRFEVIEPEANVVQVVASSQSGGRLRSALMVDWASILNQNAPNFLGRWRLEIFPIDGVLTCAEVNRIAYTLFKQTRRRHLRVKLLGDYVQSLRVGRVCTLEGQSGTWRVMKIDAQWEHQGYPTAQYEMELVEPGYM